MATLVANMLQQHYERHRVPETWGTPSVSHPVFHVLRTRGFWQAGKELRQRIRQVGLPTFSTAEKIIALVTGVGLVTLADKLLQCEKKPAITCRAIRTFSPQAKKSAIVLYTLGAACLVAANERSDGGGPRYPGTEYRVYSQPNSGDGGGEVEQEFLDDFDTDLDSRGGHGNN